jgi:flavin-binding protein dodecin
MHISHDPERPARKNPVWVLNDVREARCAVRCADSSVRRALLINTRAQSRFDSNAQQQTNEMTERIVMAKKNKSADSVYRVTEVIGTSTKSWEDAAKNAVETASRTLRDLRIAEVVKQDLKVEQGKVKAYRTRVLLSFKYGS